MTKELRDEIIKARESGMTYSELCNTFDVPCKEIKQLIKGVKMSGKCKYCGCKTQQYAQLCSKCIAKRKTWRELHKLVCHIKELADKERLERSNG